MIVAPSNTIYGGVMVYVNQNIYMGKTSKKVLGPKYFYGPFQGPLKLKKRKNLGHRNLEFFTLSFKFGKKMQSFAPK